MSQTIIPLEFEQYMQEKILAGKAPDMNEIIFAYIPELDLSLPIDRAQGLCDEKYIVHKHQVDQVGRLGANAIVYSAVIAEQITFKFNAIYMHDKNAINSCGMIIFKPVEIKETGMVITKSLVQEYDCASAITGITVDAKTWQIDYQARLFSIENDHRLSCLDNYGHTAFITGFDVLLDETNYIVKKGICYIGGLRTVLEADLILKIKDKPSFIYIDVCRDGTAISAWKNNNEIIISNEELLDYITDKKQHFVAAIAKINLDGSIQDLRTKGGLKEHLESANPHPQYANKNGNSNEDFNAKKVFSNGKECLTEDSIPKVEIIDATEKVKGIAQIATDELAIEGLNNTTIMTPLKVKKAVLAIREALGDKGCSGLVTRVVTYDTVGSFMYKPESLYLKVIVTGEGGKAGKTGSSCQWATDERIYYGGKGGSGGEGGMLEVLITLATLDPIQVTVGGTTSFGSYATCFSGKDGHDGTNGKTIGTNGDGEPGTDGDGGDGGTVIASSGCIVLNSNKGKKGQRGGFQDGEEGKIIIQELS